MGDSSIHTEGVLIVETYICYTPKGINERAITVYTVKPTIHTMSSNLEK